jgi:hypothetical protein
MLFGQEMNAIPLMIERMRMRPDVGVVDQGQSWRLLIPKGETHFCEVTVPHAVFEWFASVRDSDEGKEVWSDWMDYEGYNDSSQAELEESMADDVERFIDRVSKVPLCLPLSIYQPKQEAEARSSAGG